MSRQEQRIPTHRKEITMSNQPEHENQQPETVTPEEVRQSLLAEIEAGKQAITELSDDQLEEVAGGRFGQNRAMLKQAAIWTVGGTLASYGVSMLGSLFGGGQSSSQGGGQSSSQGGGQYSNGQQ
jgi:hypothetical protein